MNHTINFSYWKILTILLSLGWIVLWIYRAALPPIYFEVKQTLNITSNVDIGRIATCYFFAYVIFQVPAGIISDKMNKRFVLAFGFLFFSLATFVISLTKSITIIYIASAMAGLSGAFFYGAAFSLSAKEIPSEKRNIANAIINGGTSVGMVLGMVGSAWLVKSLGLNWQVMLMAIGILILIVFMLYFSIIRNDNTKTQHLTSRENDISANSQTLPAQGGYFKPAKLGIYLVLFCSCYANFQVVTWMAHFLNTERQFPGSHAGMIAALVGLAAVPGSLLFGMAADKYQHHKKNIMVILPVMAALALAITVHSSNSLMIMVGLSCYGFLGKLALDPMLISTITELSNRKKLATSLSIYNFFGMSASFIAPWLSGVISDKSGSMLPAFNIAILFLAIGAMVLILVFSFKGKTHNRSQYEY